MERLFQPRTEKRCSFELFKSNVCHKLKRLGDVRFLIETLEHDEIRAYYLKQWYPECFYLLAMVDYLSRENRVELCKEYDDLRKQKLAEVIYPASIVALCTASGSSTPKEQSIQDAIPEFLRFNIVENDVRNVV